MKRPTTTTMGPTRAGFCVDGRGDASEIMIDFGLRGARLGRGGRGSYPPPDSDYTEGRVKHNDYRPGRPGELASAQRDSPLADARVAAVKTPLA